MSHRAAAGTSTRDPYQPSAGPSEPAAERPHSFLLDVVVVVGWFVVLGAIGAVIWWQLVDLPQVTRSGKDVVIEPAGLTRQVGADGWFAVIAVPLGLLSGVLLTWWRDRDPVVTVLLVTGAAGVAALVMQHLGGLLGPGDPVAAVRAGAEGPVAVPLEVYAAGVLWLWPLAAALGALIWLWTTAGESSGTQRGSAASEARDQGIEQDH